MNTVDTIMELADDYAGWREAKGQDHPASAEARQALRAALERALTGAVEPAACECHRCIKENDLRDPGGRLPLSMVKMILCPQCGNKRCPKASDHRLACTGSNDSGQPGSVYAERDQLAAALEAAREDVSIARRALLWLTGGDSGMSSKAICCHMLGMKSDGSFPLDPSDFGRCLRLLELFPEWKPRMGEMARYSAQWAALVERWDELAEMMADEVGIDWSKGERAPRTYAAMKDAMLKAREASND